MGKLIVGASVAIFALAGVLPLDEASALTRQQLRQKITGFSDVCRMGGGNFKLSSGAMTCCWPNWGCLVCDLGSNSCEIICDTPACAEANDITRGEFSPNDVGPPRSLRPLSPDRLAPGGGQNAN